MKSCLIVALLIFPAVPSPAQRRVDIHNTYERLRCIVPMSGAGTMADPKRPMFAPTPAQISADKKRTGIIAFGYQLSDDGKFALVEFVAQSRAAFNPIVNSRAPNVTVFERGKSTSQQIETEFKKYKRNFDSSKFRVAVP